MLKKIVTLSSVGGLLLSASTSMAHFGTLIPSDDIISQGDSRKVEVDLKFLHPVEGNYMNLAKPKQFGVLNNGKLHDLKPGLRKMSGHGPGQKGEFDYWQADYKIKRPGDYTFYMEPNSYWEPAEDKYIIHYTKVCVSAFGMDNEWDVPVGLKTEIVPLTRPFGLWKGNVFRGQVLLEGKPAADTEVEVEFLNEAVPENERIEPPSDPYVTQVVKTDKNGIFVYAMPKAGWWGFAALSDASWKIPHDGVDKGVEIGAVYWVKTRNLK
jgi:cobalt/nickel transport protein